MNILTVTGARKRYGSVQALDGASFELRKGELRALLGPNGAGKTTLIRAISGRVRLDGAQIRVFDQAVVAPRVLGIAPQELAVYPLLTARENLDGFGRLHGLSGTELSKQMDRALERTGLADRAREPVKQFSGVGARRLPESVLAQCRAMGTLAAGAGAERTRRRHFSERATPAGTPVGTGVRPLRISSVACVLAILLAVASACRDLDVVTEAYATLAEAQAAGAVDRGWLPRGLPPGTRDVRVAHDLDSSRRWGLFEFPPAEGDLLRQLLSAEISFEGLTANPPRRIEWWPLLLRERLDGERLKATGLRAYPAKEHDLIYGVNWAQGRAYYWSRE